MYVPVAALFSPFTFLVPLAGSPVLGLCRSDMLFQMME